MSVHDSLAVRIDNVKKTGFADEIIVEEYLGQKISDIEKYDIDTFVIGDDWKGVSSTTSPDIVILYTLIDSGCFKYNDSSGKIQMKAQNRHYI